MSKVKSCIVCSKSITNRRCDAKTCSNSCRTALWRLSSAGPVPVKVVLSQLQYNQLKADADDIGVLINQLIIARSTKPFNSIGGSL